MKEHVFMLLLGALVLSCAVNVNSVIAASDIFSPPQNISNNPGQTSAPSMVRFGTNFIVTWYDDSSGNFEIYFAKSIDGGKTFSTPLNISNSPGASAYPSIATDGANIFIAWFEEVIGQTSDQDDIFFAKSTDGGLTFSVPHAVSTTPGTSQLASIATDGTNIIVAWADASPNNFDIYFSKSTDGGLTFSSPQNISNTPTESNHPSIATDGSSIFLAWHEYSSPVTNVLIYFTKSTDGGITFDAPQAVSNDASYSFNPYITTKGTEVLLAWGDGNILFTKSTDGGSSFSTPLTVSNDGGGSYPTIATDGSAILVTWHDRSSGNFDIYYSKSTDDGTTFSSQQNISNNPGNSVSPSVATDGTNIVIAWMDDSPGNFDAFVSRSPYVASQWTITGYYSPVDMGGVLNTMKSGQSVPLKFEVFDGSVEKTSTSDIASFTQKQISCSSLSTAISDPVEVTNTGGTSLRYDTSSGQFIGNWKSPSGNANTCWEVKTTTINGPSISAYFKLK